MLLRYGIKKCRPHSSLTLSESNGSKVICFHNISLNWNVGIQYIATVADSSIVDEDIHLSITLQDLLCSSVHCVCVSQVKDNRAGSVSLVVEQNRRVISHLTVIIRYNHLCMPVFKLFCDNWSLKIKERAAKKLFLTSNTKFQTK